MNLDKISSLLCFAFQDEGPFQIKLVFDGGTEETLLTREEIKTCSDSEFCQSLDFSKRISNRRWRDRGSNDRRN